MMFGFTILLTFCVNQIYCFDKCFDADCVDESKNCALNAEPQCRIREAYLGQINVTRTGTPCVTWVKMPSAYHSTYGRHNHNFCRNPDGDKRPWCFRSTSGSWDYCFNVCAANTTISNDNLPNCPDVQCVLQDESLALAESGECRQQEAYLGTKNVTIYGMPCVQWVHTHTQYNNLNNHNYCRNPNGHREPYCYIKFQTDSKVWQPCFQNPTEKCGNCLDTKHGKGCNVRGIDRCVCWQREQCCTEDWDVNCAALVAGCGCLDGKELPCANCLDTDHGPGCSNKAIEACVCKSDPHCCDITWDSKCVTAVTQPDKCDVTCEQEKCYDCVVSANNRPVDGWSPETGSKGCMNKRIQSCVCATDPDCCNLEWTQQCADKVRENETCWRGGCAESSGQKGRI